MGASIKVGRILGIPVSLHISWFVVLLVFVFLFQSHYDEVHPSWAAGERWAVALATSLMLFLSVLAHELSHSVVAIRRGIPVNGITLFVFGGVSHIGREANRPSTEFVIAVVGPAASIVLGVLFLGLALALEGISGHLAAIAWVLVYANIMLGIFNMLPGFPMDGGRVVRAAVWRVSGDYWRATRLATRASQFLAGTMVAGGIVLVLLPSVHWVQGAWLILIGIFLQAMASASYRQVRLRQSLTGLRAEDVMSTSYTYAPHHVSLVDVSRAMMADVPPVSSTPDYVVLYSDGGIRGLIARAQGGGIRLGRRTVSKGSSLVVPVENMPVVGPEEDALVALDLIEERKASHALVIENGVLLGVLGREELANRSAERLPVRA